jgi:hypothetical protein
MILLFFVAVALAGVTIPFKYPLFLQCNSTWKNDVMEGSKTICDVGCLMSSVAMALNGKGIDIPENNGNLLAANPAVLNKWLRNNGGYDSSADLDEAVVPKISPSQVAWIGSFIPTATLPAKKVVRDLADGKTVIMANVRNGTHFVLVTGMIVSNLD